MRPTITRNADGIVTGNTYDKYGSKNPAVRRLMRRFESNVDELIARADPHSIVDVGCGEGILASRWAEELFPYPVVGVDLRDAALQAEWQERRAPNLRFQVLESDGLPFDDNSFDLASAIEVLEHVPDPRQTFSEMKRVASGWMLVSVPREPLWRLMNLARGAYIRDLGNTPGHVNHWSKRAFVALASQYGDPVEVRSPWPWTMLLLRVDK